MNRALLNLLRCPFCGGKFTISGCGQISSAEDYAVLTCYCGRYPVVSGIPVLKKNKVCNEVIDLIEAGFYSRALHTLLMPPDLLSKLPSWKKSIPKMRGMVHRRELRLWHERIASLLADRSGHVTACDLFDLYFSDREAYNYFVFRFGQPRHLVALSFASIIGEPDRPILDLSCGCGHITRNLLYRAKAQQVIGTDSSFFGLFVAKHWIAPKAEYVCCTSDATLPFPDGFFSVVFCSNAFHEFGNKVAGIREMRRVIGAEGLVILACIHSVMLGKMLSSSYNGLHPSVNYLPPDGYQELVADMPHAVVADSEVLSRYLEKKGPPLDRAVGLRHLTHEPTLSIVVSFRKEVFQDYGLFHRWPHSEGRLGINPLYLQEKPCITGDYITLIRKFPSKFYEKVHTESKNYLPQEIEVHRKKVGTDLINGRGLAECEQLIEHCAILDIPELYWRQHLQIT